MKAGRLATKQGQEAREEVIGEIDNETNKNSIMIIAASCNGLLSGLSVQSYTDAILLRSMYVCTYCTSSGHSE